MDPTDPDSDPQHWFFLSIILTTSTKKGKRKKLKNNFVIYLISCRLHRLVWRWQTVACVAHPSASPPEPWLSFSPCYRKKYFAKIRQPFNFLQYSGQCCESALVLMRIRIQGAKSMQIHADMDPLFRIRTDPVELSQWIRIQAGKNIPKKEKMKKFHI
jgi:hypothetical protein